MIALIWAMDENRVIGKDNRLPWHYPEDLKYFKTITKGKKVIMGRHTYDSMITYFKDGKLPYEKVYVASRKTTGIQNATVINDLDTFFKHHKEDIFVLGGSFIYEVALKYADVLFITYILNRHEGDTTFPSYDLSSFTLSYYETKPHLILTKYERNRT